MPLAASVSSCLNLVLAYEFTFIKNKLFPYTLN